MKYFRRLKLYLFGAMLLVACQNTGPAVEAPAIVDSKSTTVSRFTNTTNITEVQANRFTTAGKPTRLYETPSGPIQLYDISQDPEVSRAIDEVYADGKMTFGDLSFRSAGQYRTSFHAADEDITPAAILIMKARDIAYYDLFRSSCLKPERVPCGDGYAGWGAKYLSQCPSCNLGKMPNKVVKRHSETTEEIRFNYNRLTERVVTKDIFPKGRWGVQDEDVVFAAQVDECSRVPNEPVLLKHYYVGAQSGYSLEEARDFLLHHECGEWADLPE